MDTGNLEKVKSKIFPDRLRLKSHLAEHRSDAKIVFTNGCFDLLHHGHISTLSRARDLGDLLVVGLNSDDSVRRLKGPTRPVTKELDRALVLASLQFVDFVTIFSEQTPIETLGILKPTVHVKGGDYKVEDLPEREIVVSSGGRIVVLPFEPGYSTTEILKHANS